MLETNESLANMKDKDGNTALHLSISHGKEDCLKTLFFFYPDMTVTNNDGETPLYFAAKYHAWNMFMLLCEHDAKLDLYHPKGITGGESLLVMAFRDHHGDTVRYLIDHGADWHDIDTKVNIYIISLILEYFCLTFLSLSLLYIIFQMSCREIPRFFNWYAKN